MSGTLPADRRASLRVMTQSVPGNGTFFFFYCYYLRSMQTSAFLMGVVSVTTTSRGRTGDAETFQTLCSERLVVRCLW